MDRDGLLHRVVAQPQRREGLLHRVLAQRAIHQVGKELIAERLVMAVQLAVRGDHHQLRFDCLALMQRGTWAAALPAQTGPR